MTKVALIFPGQGAQKVGMGKEFYASSPVAREIFDAADTILKRSLTRVMFEGPQEELTSTAYCQPAIFTMSVAALRAFEAHAKSGTVEVAFAAGLSLGEYSALAAAGALSFEDGLRLVEQRSSFMEEATRLQKGTMAAVIGCDKDNLVAICRATGAEVANFNSPEQVVITGHAAKVEAACERIRSAGAKSVIPLDVSGAFHSTLMTPAALRFAGALKGVVFQNPRVPVISNVDARPEMTPEAIRGNLAKQITSSVQWVDSIQFIAARGVTHFIEIGPGKVLRGLLRRINSDFKVQNIERPEDIDALQF